MLARGMEMSLKKGNHQQIHGCEGSVLSPPALPLQRTQLLLSSLAGCGEKLARFQTGELPKQQNC